MREGKQTRRKYDQQKKRLTINGLNEWPNYLSQSRLEPNFAQMKQLYLTYCKVGQVNISGLKSEQFPALQKLYLYSNQITPYALLTLMNLSKFNAFSRIQYLSLSDNFIGSLGVKLLTKNKMLQLKGIWINKCFIGEEGAKAIVKSKWKKLEKLMISTLRNENRIGVDGCSALSMGNWSELNNLQKYETDQKMIVNICSLTFVCIQSLLKRDYKINFTIPNLEIQQNIKQVYNTRFKLQQN